MSLCYAIIQSGCPVCAWSGDLHNANRLLSMLLESSAKWPVVYWSWWAKSYKIVFASISQTDLAAAWAHHVRELTFIPLMLETMGTLKSELIDPRVLPHAEDDRISWATPELLRGSGEMRLHEPTALKTKEVRGAAFPVCYADVAKAWLFVLGIARRHESRAPLG